MDEAQAAVAADWSHFCEKAERTGLQCRPCKARCCHLKGAKQARYKELGLRDSILICGDQGGGVIVESDIEVPFKVRPGDDIQDLMEGKELMVRMALGPQIAKLEREQGIHITDPDFHHHYNPKRLPKMAALHVHLRGKAPTVTEGKRLAERMWRAIDAPRLTKLVE